MRCNRVRSEPAPRSRDALAAFNPEALYRLLAWLSPAYPVGSFSYSSGIEWAVEAGDIGDAKTLQRWLAFVLSDGSGFCDAVFLVHAHRAAAAADDAAPAAQGAATLQEVAALACALAPAKERFLETTAQGCAFLQVTRAAWGCPRLDFLVEALVAGLGDHIPYPVAVGLAAAAHDIAVEPAAAAFLQAIAANLVSAGVRLIPLGQTDGQRVLAALEPVVAATAARALASPLEAAGSAAFRADLASMQHETQYTRLFRT